jgi:hypothetical protein
VKVHEETMLDTILALTEPGDLTTDERAYIDALSVFRLMGELSTCQAARLRRIYDQIADANTAPTRPVE